MTKAVDLGQFDAAIEAMETGIDLPIVGMDGKPLGLTIRIAGPDSARAQAAREALHQEAVESERMTPLSAAETTAQGTRFLAKLTMGWSPKVKVDGEGGEELDYSEANAIRVYEKYRFIRQQVDNAAGSRAGFFLASRKPSPKP